jgi:very-short-patch-repair endonuclease
MMRDLKRDEWMKNKGYTILRFWNNEVDNNMEGVLEKILETITSLYLSPSIGERIYME